MKKVFLFVVTSVIVSSCTVAYRRNVPLELGLENTTTLTRYLDENKVAYDVKDLATLDHINSWIYFNNNKMLSVPEAYFYNKDGFRITEDFKGDRCGAAISGIDKINSYKFDSNDSLNKWMADYLVFPFTQENVFDHAYDGYVVIFYGKVFSKYKTNPTSFNWYNRLKENKNIKTILLNIDLQDNWEITAEQKKALGLEI